MAIISVDPLSESSWIERTYPDHADYDVGVADNFIVTFSKTVDSDSLVNSNFTLQDENGNEIDDAFRDIALNNDYSSLSRSLTLHLNNALNTETEYVFSITGLYDASGDDQDAPHVLSFRTGNIPVTITSPDEEENAIQAEDDSLIDADIVDYETLIIDDVNIIRTTPTNRTYNYNGLQPFVLTFYFDRVPYDNEEDITIEKRVISQYEANWVDIVPESIVIDEANSAIIVTLEPEDGDEADDYALAAGYEYRVVVPTTVTFWSDAGSGVYAITLDNDYEYYITGPLTISGNPMFSSVNAVLLQYPNYTAYEVAKMLYIQTGVTLQLNPNVNPAEPPRAASDYAMYSTLFYLSAAMGDATRIVLADLEVEKPQESLLARWYDLMREAELRLRRPSPVWAIRGENNISPHAARDWNEEGSDKRRIGQ